MTHICLEHRLGILLLGLVVGCGSSSTNGGDGDAAAGQAAISAGSGGTSTGSGGTAQGEGGAPTTEGGAPPAEAGSDSLGASLVGTITLPADASNTCAMIAVDTDTTGSNDVARRSDGSYLLEYQLVSGTTLSFAFDRVPPGSYFIWGYVDTDASVTSPPGDCEAMGGPNSGDYLGYYDTGLGAPNAANVDVPDGGMTFDFELGVFP